MVGVRYRRRVPVQVGKVSGAYSVGGGSIESGGVCFHSETRIIFGVKSKTSGAQCIITMK